MTLTAAGVAPAWLDEVPSRTLLEDGLEASFPLPPGDRALVEVGDRVAAGDPIARAPPRPPARGGGRPARPGRRRGPGARRRCALGAVGAPAGAPTTAPTASWSRRCPARPDRWRLATGEHRVQLASPLRGR